MNHKQKVKLARRMYGNRKKVYKEGIFDTPEWEERRQNIKIGVRNREIIAHQKAEEKRKLKIKKLSL